MTQMTTAKVKEVAHRDNTAVPLGSKELLNAS